jgi:hypothetical protein
MKKQLFTALAFGLCLTTNVMAQVPSYVPTNGLVGWWPFNGNANDESGNGNNGTVTGATLTTDRNGVSNKAYYFNGSNSYIHNANPVNLPLGNTSRSASFWIRTNGTYWGRTILMYGAQNNVVDIHTSTYGGGNINYLGGLACGTYPQQLITSNQWVHFVLSYDMNSSTTKIYCNGILVSTATNVTLTTVGGPLRIGRSLYSLSNDPYNWVGEIDEVGLWNRALTQDEVYSVYSGCPSNVLTSQPTNSSITAGSTSQFSANSPAGSTYLWQSNPSNFGWQNVPTNSNYSGGNTNTLTVNNVQLSNHNQPFRVIVNAAGCIDTSNVATIQIADTCITTVYDTLYTTVTDTLIINTTLSLPAPNNENTILIYPNPASDHITIDNGNYTAMAGYTIKIENNAGQQVFQNQINQPQFYIDLSTWSGNGLYFVHLLDPQGNTVTIRKIVLQ